MTTAKNSFIIFFSEVIIAAVLFITSIIVASKFGPEGKGIFDLFSATAGLFVAIGGLGIGTASIYLINKEKENQNKILTNSLILGLLLGLILDVFFLILILLKPSLFHGLTQKYLILLFAAIPLSLFHAYLLPFFLAKLKILYWSFISIFYDVFILISIIVLVFFLGWGIDGIIYPIIISGVLAFFLIIFYISRIIPLYFVFDKKLIIKQIKTGLKVYLGGIFNTVCPKISLVIVNYFLGIVSAGIYSVALNISSILLFIPYSFQQALYAKWSLIEEKEMDQNTTQVARQAFIIGSLSSLFFFLVGGFFIIFFYGNNFYASILPLYLILPGIPFITFASIFFNNFFARGKAEITTVILTIVLFINIFLSIFLVPILGLIGAAISISVSYFIAAFLAVSFFSKISSYSFFGIIKFEISDFISLKKYFLNTFKSGKILPLTPDLTIEKLKGYYEDKALKEEDIIKGTFNSISLFKRIFYKIRVIRTLSLLNIKPEDRILEIGCGSGFYTKKIAEITPNLIATDISQNYVDIAKKYNSYKIIDYVACPAEKLPFKDGYFNKVLMSEVVEHLINPDLGIKEVWRVLGPQGVLILNTPNKHSYLNILYHIKVTLGDSLFEEEHIKEFNKKELDSLLKKYFVIEKLYYVNYFPFCFPLFFRKKISESKLTSFIIKIENFLNYLPLFKRAGFVIILKAIKRNKNEFKKN